MSKWIRVLVLAGLFVAPAAEAKKVFIDFGDQVANSGNNWDTSQSFEASLVGDSSSPSAILLGFTINTGAGNFDSIILNENGAVTFGSALPSGTFTSTSNLSTLGISIIAPYYADMLSTAANGDVFFVEDGEILYSRGVADPRPDSSGNYSSAEAVEAFHVTWAGPTVSPAFLVFTDLVIYNLGGGDFALQFGHGTDADPTIPDLGGITGFALGSNVLNLTGARSSSDDLYYEVRNGKLVPEPGTVLALAAGLALLGIARRRAA
jgi:hypothetical protein